MVYSVAIFVAINADWDFGTVRKINERLVAVIWGEVKTGEEICPENWLSDIGDDEREVVKLAVGYTDLSFRKTIARNFASVCGFELPRVGAGGSLLRGRRDDGPDCAAIDEVAS